MGQIQLIQLSRIQQNALLGRSNQLQTCGKLTECLNSFFPVSTFMDIQVPIIYLLKSLGKSVMQTHQTNSSLSIPHILYSTKNRNQSEFLSYVRRRLPVDQEKLLCWNGFIVAGIVLKFIISIFCSGCINNINQAWECICAIWILILRSNKSSFYSRQLSLTVLFQ